jgi:uncharacterized membrane protein YgcG
MKLPSIIIKQIGLFGEPDIETGVQVTTMIKDPLLSGGWSTSRISDKIISMVVISSDLELNQRLTNGNIKFNQHTITSQYGSNDGVQIFINPATSGTRVQENGEHIFVRSYEAKFSPQNSNVRVFCATIYKNRDLLQDMGLDFSNIQDDYGEITSETILTSGFPPMTTTIFLTEDNEQYMGPVHLHPQKGYMQGAYHSPEPHGLLKITNVQNFKIKDYRRKIYRKSEPTQEINNNSISRLEYSVDSSGHVKAFFSLDLKNLLLSETMYGNQLKSLSDAAFQECLRYFNINTFEIIRHRKDATQQKYIGITTANPYTGRLAGTVGENFSITEMIDVNFGQNIRTYQFFDREMNKAKIGTFHYEVKISFVDPTINFVNDLITRINTSKKTINDYYAKFEKRKNYNYDLDEPKERLYNFEFNALIQPEPKDWTRASEIYLRAMSYLYNISPAERRELLFTMSSKINPKFATLSSVSDFNDKFNRLSGEFLKMFDSFKNKAAPDSNRKFVKSSSGKNKIFINHIFQETITPRNFVMSYGYLNVNQPSNGSMPEIGVKSFADRMMREKNKFFSNQIAEQDYAMLPKNYSDLINLSTNHFSYLSPSVLRSKNEIFELTDISAINLTKINNIFNTFSNQTKNNNIFVNYARMSNDEREKSSLMGPIGPDIVEPSVVIEKNTEGENILVTSEQQVEDYLSSAKYLGDDSLFVLYDIEPNVERLLEPLSKAAPVDVQQKFNILRDINKANAQEYDIFSDKNLLFLASKKPINFTRFYNLLPNQIRALFMYQMPFVKKLRTRASGDLLKGVKTQAAININYNKLVKIEILDHYEVRNGVTQIRNPVFRILTGEDIKTLNAPKLCRLSAFESDELKIKRDQLSFPIENQYFTLIPNSTNIGAADSAQTNIEERNLQDILMQHRYASRYNLNGATTNILVQTGTANLIQGYMDLNDDGSEFTRPNDGSGGITTPIETLSLTVPNENIVDGPQTNRGTTDRSRGAAGFNEAVGNINRSTPRTPGGSMSGGGTSGGGMTGGGGSGGGYSGGGGY